MEYALILAFVVAIAAIALKGDTGIGNAIKGIFNSTGTEITNTANGAGGNN